LVPERNRLRLLAELLNAGEIINHNLINRVKPSSPRILKIINSAKRLDLIVRILALNNSAVLVLAWKNNLKGKLVSHDFSRSSCII
jgi:hypothetical protein